MDLPSPLLTGFGYMSFFFFRQVMFQYIDSTSCLFSGTLVTTRFVSGLCLERLYTTLLKLFLLSNGNSYSPSQISHRQIKTQITLSAIEPCPVL